MNMKSILMTGAVVAAALGASAPASAAIVYMTGTNNPWGETTNEAAMDGAFGAGNWTKANGFDAGVFAPANSFIFFDGGDTSGQEFADFLGGNLSALTSFVNAGGKVFSNLAQNNGPNTINLGFGYTSLYSHYSNTAFITGAGVTAGLSGSGAGVAWTGNSFGHNFVTGSGTCYVEGFDGSDTGCVFAGGAQGAGAYFVGGQTTTNFHSGGNPLQLRINELKLASDFQGGAGPVPEPATWAMMIGGFGMVGGTMRYRRRKTTVAFA